MVSVGYLMSRTLESFNSLFFWLAVFCSLFFGVDRISDVKMISWWACVGEEDVVVLSQIIDS